MPTEDWKRELCEIFFARLGMILIIALIVLGGAAGVAFWWPTVYAASGQVLIKGKGARLARPESLVDEQSRNVIITKEDVESEIEILTSTDLIRQTLAYIDQRQKALAKGEAPPTHTDIARHGEETGQVDRQYDELAREIRMNLETSVVPGSNVILIALRSPRGAHWAEETLQAHLGQYIAYRAILFNPTDQQSFFRERAESYQRELDAIDEQMMTLARESSIGNPQKEMDDNITLRTTLITQLNLLRDLYIDKDRQATPIREALKNGDIQYFTFLNIEAVDNLSRKLMDIQEELGQALRGYREDSAIVVGIRQNFDLTFAALREEVSRLLASREAEIEGLRERIARLEQSIAEADARGIVLKQHIVAIERMEHEKALLKASYETFRKRREEAQMNQTNAAASLSGEVSILSRAEGTGKPVFPLPWWQMLLFGAVVGLVSGGSLAFLMEYLDHTCKRPSEIARYVGLPVVCSIRKF